MYVYTSLANACSLQHKLSMSLSWPKANSFASLHGLTTSVLGMESKFSTLMLLCSRNHGILRDSYKRGRRELACLQEGGVVPENITEEGAAGGSAWQRGPQDTAVAQHKALEQVEVMEAGEVGDVHAAATHGPGCRMHHSCWMLTAPTPNHASSCRKPNDCASST